MNRYELIALDKGALVLRAPPATDSGQLVGPVSLPGVTVYQYLTGASQALSSNPPPTVAVGDLVNVSAYSSATPKCAATWKCTSVTAALPSGAVAGNVTGNALGILYVPNEVGSYYKYELVGDANILAFGAMGDGTTDDTLPIQAALNQVNGIGGGVVYIPTGTFRKGDNAGSILVMYSNTTIRGNGDKSVIFFDDKDTVPRSGNDFLNCDNTTNIAFENFKITGTALVYLNETNHKQCLTGGGITGLRMTGVTVEKVRYMATAFSSVNGGQLVNNSFDYIVRDGLRCTSSNNIVVSNNIFRRVADDAVALHSLDSSTTPGSGFVVTNNVFEGCQGIKVLGAKVLNIQGNVMRRCLRNPVLVQIPGTGTEGNTPQFAINISDNTITDTSGEYGTNYAIRVACSLARDDGGLSTQPGVNSAPYDYTYLNNLDSGTPVIIGQFGIRIANNIISRTLGAVTNYSDWGYGDMFDRITVGFISDPAITSSYFQLHGVNIVAPAAAVQIAGNNISGCGTGFSGVLLGITGSTNIQDYGSISILGNTLYDCPGSGVSCVSLGSGAGAKQIIISDNTFDLDPFFRASTHNADNTWTSTTAVAGISVSNTIGLVCGSNVFKNCGGTGIAGSITVEYSANVVYADFVGPGDNAGNKGVRLLPSAAIALIVPIDGDPASATFGHIINAVNTRSLSIPTTGRYLAGQRVWKDTPIREGGGGSQYTILGWLRVTTGTNHVLNTDWFEMRTLTGT
jgi:hypothetical protein